ncbi:MAG TPA: hypothetical protein DD636_07555 [Anaerolineaceae bacterium]|jgi:archaellum component FlaF (FlaF/FlaG flagellin family)|nr:hypothetical protein [Anaerolineaceae bacterium]
MTQDRPNIHKSIIIVLVAVLVVLVSILYSAFAKTKTQLSEEDITFIKQAGLKETDDINNTMRLSYLNNEQVAFSKGEIIDVMANLYNQKHPVRIISNKTTFFYVQNEDTKNWELIDNVLFEFGEETIIEPYPGLNPLPNVIGGIPNPEKITESMTIRILIVGSFVDETKANEDKVAAFMDIEVTP